MNRRETVEALIEWRGNLAALQAQLRERPFDSATPLATLQTKNIAEALKRFLAGSVSARDVECWAESVEGREDIKYAEKSGEAIAQALFVLSLPDINGPLTVQTAKDILGQLGHAL